MSVPYLTSLHQSKESSQQLACSLKDSLKEVKQLTARASASFAASSSPPTSLIQVPAEATPWVRIIRVCTILIDVATCREAEGLSWC